MGVTVKDFPQHFIRKQNTNFRPGRVLYLDTETKTQPFGLFEKHRMKIAWTCYTEKRHASRNDTEKWKFWENALDMQEYIESMAHKKSVLYLFGHNIFFDLQVSDFFYYFTKRGWKLDFVYDKGLVYILSIHKDKAKIKCLSTTNFYPTSLAKIGKMLGLEKLDVDFKESTPEELKVYCRRDVEIVKATMEQYWSFLDKHDLGRFMSTKSSQAFTAFRHRFMHTKISVHKDPELSEFEKLSYYGGRVEAGFIGEVPGGPFVSLDVNSMYPFVMRTQKYPVKAIDYIEKPEQDQIDYVKNKHCVVAEVYLDTDEPAYAYRQDNKIIFPVGAFPTYLCTEGLNYAIDHGHLVRVERMAVYEKDYIFNDYVDYFYELKKEYSKQDNVNMRTLTKYFLNSLYGKFGQKKPLIEEEDDFTCDGYSREETFDVVTGKKEIITKLFNKTFIEWGEEVGSNSFIAVAAHVTEHARFYLYRLMKDIGLENVLYMDTDSLKIRRSDLHKLTCGLDDEKLGALALEEEFDQFTIHGPKDYETENMVKLKGVPKNAVKLGEGKYHYTSFPKQDTHLRKQITRFYFTRPTTKTLKRVYTKGLVQADGSVKPIRLNVKV